MKATVLSVAALAASLLPFPAAADPAPVRHLVYSFTWGSNNDTEVHVSGMGDGGSGTSVGSGMVSNTAGITDKGTITVDVLREQSDRGLVVNISEQAQEGRSAPVATCVVYGNTNFVCDPNKKVNAEELTLLRFLGSTFVDPNQIDGKQHWQIVQNDPGVAITADYTIAKNDGGKMIVDEVRILKSTKQREGVENVNATIGYDFNRTLPLSVDEYSIARSEAGEQYVTIKTQTVLQLQSDSLAKN